QIDYGDLQLDLHLMTEEPMDFVREIVALKEYLPVRAVIAQVERMSHQGEFLAEIKKYSWKAGLSLDLYTPVEAIDPESWQDLDIVQLMTIRAGFQSQEFKQNALEKLVEIRQLAKSDVEIIVDGGVKIEYIELLAEAEVDGVTVGSGLWRATNPIQAIKEYSQLMDQTNND
ncbi:hypothetical protein KJ654_01155, partial [Patescibacteria group bacterium]|nr:hypothetical protein [Patescibacteria group bacterium]MBU1967124.1 hypothetical protein [Patescibacteria group bacterium]